MIYYYRQQDTNKASGQSSGHHSTSSNLGQQQGHNEAMPWSRVERDPLLLAKENIFVVASTGPRCALKETLKIVPHWFPSA